MTITIEPGALALAALILPIIAPLYYMLVTCVWRLASAIGADK